jgi:hypothetical protein
MILHAGSSQPDSIRELEKGVFLSLSDITSDGIRNFYYGVITMKHFNQKLLTASILLVLGAASSAWANPTNTDANGSQTASVDATSHGLGNATASESGTSTVGDITKNSNNTETFTDNSDGLYGLSDASKGSAANNGSGYATTSTTKTDTYTDNSDGLYGISAASDGAASNNGSGTATTTKTISKTDDSDGKYGISAATDYAASNNGSGYATTTKTDNSDGKNGASTADADFAASNNGSGYATTTKTINHTGGVGEDAFVKAKYGSAAANVGDATSTNTKSQAKGDGSASTITGDANALYLEQTQHGWGNLAAGSIGGNSTVNNQKLEGEVTGYPVAVVSSVTQGPDSLSVLASLTGNKISNSVIGNAGITQTFQNSGTALAQQAVQVSGTINVGSGGSATVTQQP